MMNPIALVIEKISALVALRAFSRLQSDVTRGLAQERAALQGEAQRYEREGQHEAAALLRQGSGQLSLDLAGLDDIDTGLARLLRPDPLARPASSSEAAPPPALLLSEPSVCDAPRRGPGRPRKDPAPSGSAPDLA